MDCQCRVEDLATDVISFIDNVKEISPTPDNVVTPYLHALIAHVPNMVQTYGSLRMFSTSAQELKNSLQTMKQFRGSNQKNVPEDLAIHQLLLLYFTTRQELLDVPLPRSHSARFEFEL